MRRHVESVGVQERLEHEIEFWWDKLGGKRRALWLAGGCAVGFFVGAVVFGGVMGAAAATGDGDTVPRARSVLVVPVFRDAGLREFRGSGLTRAVDRAELSFTVGGRLASRRVQIGDHVGAGDVLAELDRAPFENAVRAAAGGARQASAQSRQAARDRRRLRSLSDAEVTSTMELEQATTAVRTFGGGRTSARAQLDEARRMLAEANLVAPFAGVVTDVLLQPGEFAMPGRPVLILSGDDGIEIEVEVPEVAVGRIEPGSSVHVSLPLADIEGLTGTVRVVGLAASHQGRVFPVIVRLPDAPRVVPGMAAEIVFQVQVEPELAVPVTAVVDPGGHHPTVFKVHNGRAHRVAVTVHDLVEGRVTVRGALAEGDHVVVGGHGGLTDGEEVHVQGRPTR